jgi:SAM-dependent methyltransferase
MDAVAPDWLPNEVDHAGRENLDADHVRRYDGKMDASADDEVTLLRRLGLTSTSVVVEFGPGTGQFTQAVAGHCGNVVAVDVSPPMLAALHASLDRAGVANVELVASGFLSYKRPPASVDVVYSRLALHHLPDFWKVRALYRIAAMLRSGGLFRLWDVVYDFEPDQADDRLERWCATGQDVPPGQPVDGGWGRWEVAEHVRDEHSTYRWLLEAMIERVGLRVEDVDVPDHTTARYVLRKP